MAAPRILIADLPEQATVVDTDLLVVQDGPTTKQMTVGRLTTQSAAAIDAHVSNPTGAHAASAITAVPNVEPMGGIDVQMQLAQGAGALSSLQTTVDSNTTAFNDHLSDTTDAHGALAISVAAIPGLSSANVQDALTELFATLDALGVDVNDVSAALDTHIADADAHPATNVSVQPSGNLTALNVQAALVELQSSIDGLATQMATTIARVGTLETQP